MAGCNNTLHSLLKADIAYYWAVTKIELITSPIIISYTTRMAGCNNTLHSLIKADIAYYWAVTKIELITSAIIIILHVLLAAITLYTVL